MSGKSKSDSLAIEVKKNLSQRIALYDLESLKKGYELRVWTFYALMEPTKLFILKVDDSMTTAFMYQIFRERAPNYMGLDFPVDTVIMQSLKPLKVSWNKYLQRVHLDSLDFVKTQSELKDQSFGMLDGSTYYIEFSHDGKYQFLQYSEPFYFMDKSRDHAIVARFLDRLKSPFLN